METIGRKLFSVLNYAKLFLFTTSTKSQTPLLQFFLRGGGGGGGGEVRAQATLLKDWS